MAVAADTLKRMAYLTMDSAEGWSIDVELAFPYLRKLGWSIEGVPWRRTNTQSTKWDSYQAVYIGVPWDYPEDPDLFLEVLGSINDSKAILVNSFETVKWNLQKTYLRDLEEKGTAIVPSLWNESSEPISRKELDAAFETFACFGGEEKLIVKPVVSANAIDTFVITKEGIEEKFPQLVDAFSGNRPFLMQPFITNIQKEGEFSLFFMEHEYSHAIQKIPGHGDFRVQEEHGGSIVALLEPINSSLRETGEKLLQLLIDRFGQLAYARLDFVRNSETSDQFLVMEVELIEPSMYLRMVCAILSPSNLDSSTLSTNISHLGFNSLCAIRTMSKDENAPGRFAIAFDKFIHEASSATI